MMRLGIAILSLWLALAPAYAQVGGLSFPGPGPKAASVTPFTWNPADAATGITLANSNRDLTGTSSGNFASVRTTQGYTSGLIYCEFKFTALGTAGAQPQMGLGIANATFPLTAGNYLGAADKSAMYYWLNQNTFNSTAITVANAVTGAQNITLNDIIQIAADFTTGKVWIGQNNTWKTGNPSAGTGPWLTFTAGSDTWFFAGMQNTASGSITSATATLLSTTSFSPPTGFSVCNQ